MSEGTMREVVALIDDAYDGLIRLLDDARRFGFGLQELKLVTDANGIHSGHAALRFDLLARGPQHREHGRRTARAYDAQRLEPELLVQRGVGGVAGF
jgi:hypothetical protein